VIVLSPTGTYPLLRKLCSTAFLAAVGEDAINVPLALVVCPGGRASATFSAVN
jgi:hypothetical protein